MITLLRNILAGHNEFASGGLMLMVLGGIGVYLRAIPEHFWQWFIGQITMTITVKDDDAGFVWVKEWFMEQPFLRRIRSVDLDTTMQSRKLALMPAPGRHWFWHRRRPFEVWFYRTKDSKGYTNRRLESLCFRTLGRKQRFLEEFVKEIAACHERRVRMQSCLFVRTDDYWDRVTNYLPRRLESVILKGGEKEGLIEDVQKFKEARERYRELGVPYHRGYLLYGPPGTGKTSLISGLAAKFAMPIYAVNLTDFNDKTLMKAIHDIPSNSIILFEDVDCIKMAKSRSLPNETGKNGRPGPEQEKAPNCEGLGVSLSGLLNVLDGFYAPENMLFFMTTNKVEALDDALLRPGRIDYRLFLGRADDAQKIELYLRFFPSACLAKAEDFVATHAFAETMAEYQGLLLKASQRSAAAIDDRPERVSENHVEAVENDTLQEA